MHNAFGAIASQHSTTAGTQLYIAAAGLFRVRVLYAGGGMVMQGGLYIAAAGLFGFQQAAVPASVGLLAAVQVQLCTPTHLPIPQRT